MSGWRVVRGDPSIAQRAKRFALVSTAEGQLLFHGVIGTPMAPQDEHDIAPTGSAEVQLWQMSFFDEEGSRCPFGLELAPGPDLLTGEGCIALKYGHNSEPRACAVGGENTRASDFGTATGGLGGCIPRHGIQSSVSQVVGTLCFA